MKKQVLRCVCSIAFALTGGCSNANGGNGTQTAQPYQDAAMEFDHAKWVDEDNASKAPYPRQQMISSLTKTKLKPGVLMKDVTVMLGESTKTNKFTNHGLVYWIGPEKGQISIDSQWLVIDFDSDQRLKSFDIITD
jgi:hypothetical protein